MDRRNFLALASSIGLAGCASTTSTTETGSASPTTSPSSTPSATQSPTETSTQTPTPTPRPVATQQSDAPDAWFREGHDVNRSRFNRGGKLPNEKPEFEKHLEIDFDSRVVVDDELFYSNDEEVDSKIHSYNLETGKDQLYVDANFTPWAYTDTLLAGGWSYNTLQAIKRGSKEHFHDDSGNYGRVLTFDEYDGSVVIVREEAVVSISPNGTDWVLETGRVESFVDGFFFADSVLVKTKGESWKRIRIEDGSVMAKGKYLPSTLSASLLPRIGADGPLSDILKALSDGLLPTAYTENVFFWSNLGDGTVAYHIESGNRIWSADLTAKKIAVTDGVVVVADRETAVALDASTGERLWQVETQTARWTSLLPVGGKLIVNGAMFRW